MVAGSRSGSITHPAPFGLIPAQTFVALGGNDDLAANVTHSLGEVDHGPFHDVPSPQGALVLVTAGQCRVRLDDRSTQVAG